VAKTIVIPMSRYPEFLKKLGVRAITAAKRGAHRAAIRSQQHLVRETSNAPPANPAGIGTGGAVNYGVFKRSWRSQKTSYGGVVYNLSPYADIIERGRRAGSRFPPLRIIAQWAQRRLGLSRQEAERAAYPIARAIAQRGLIGRKILENAEQDIISFALYEVNKELLAEMRKTP
jgi:hypothetical protein